MPLPASPPSSDGSPGHRPFALLLGGGGARGFAHAGVLHALEALGYRPSAVVGVSMGAIVGATYALREDWYRALIDVDTSALPRPMRRRTEELALRERLRLLVAYPRAAHALMTGWGVGEPASETSLGLIRELTAGRRLEEGRIPIVVSTTDLRSGERVLLRTGDAAEAVLASAALAGVMPPRPVGEWLLADGGYVDPAPVDVAREMGLPVVAVALGQAQHAESVSNGYQAFLRAAEIGHLRYAAHRFEEADLVLRPAFAQTVPTLDFDARRACAAAGARAVRAQRVALAALLAVPVADPVAEVAVPAGPTAAGLRRYWEQLRRRSA